MGKRRRVWTHKKPQKPETRIPQHRIHEWLVQLAEKGSPAIPGNGLLVGHTHLLYNHTNFKNPLMLEIIQTEEKMNKINLLCDFDSCNFRNRKGVILLVYKSAKLLEVRGFLLCVSCRTSDWREARRDFYL